MAKKLKTASDEIRKLSDKDLGKEIDESYRRLFSLRLQKETLQLRTTASCRTCAGRSRG